jgi:UDP-GlcNAc3NAcA epimerase
MKSDKNNPLVINVGDVMYDVILYAVELAQGKSKILQELNLMSKEYCLLTMHRAENTDHQEKFEKMIRYVNEIFEGRKVIFPMHPRTRKTYLQVRTRFHDNIRIIDSVGYFDILTLLNNSSLLATDSGGMQKEAYWLKVPCVTLRDETEWTETIESGWNVLYRDYTGRHRHSDEESTFYGDGRASQRIVKTIVNLQT